MAGIEVILPQMGESVAEATITNWLVKPGDAIEEEDPIVEIATDKVDSEVPSPVGGTVTQLLFEVGEVAKVGQAIAVVTPLNDDGNDAPMAHEPQAPPAAEIPYVPSPAPSSQSSELDLSTSERFYSPLVKKIAKEEGISASELESIDGSGSGGRVTKKDVLDYLSARQTSAQKATSTKETEQSTPAPTHTSVPVASTDISAQNLTDKYEGQNVELIEMDRMRKLIAHHMVVSNQTSAHVTSFVEADVTNMVTWRNKNKAKFEAREHQKLTFTPLFIEAIAKALKDFPMLNSSVEGNFIVKKHDINIGMATALSNGNLIVPVIKNADDLNLGGLAKKVNDLANRARTNQLQPDEIKGGTFTVTNVGTFGSIMGTPIINQPEVAILALGAIQKQPAVIETPMGDTIGIRHKMFLSMSYDHRIIDGALGSQFLRRVGDYLEQFDVNKEI